MGPRIREDKGGGMGGLEDKGGMGSLGTCLGGRLGSKGRGWVPAPRRHGGRL